MKHLFYLMTILFSYMAPLPRWIVAAKPLVPSFKHLFSSYYCDFLHKNRSLASMSGRGYIGQEKKHNPSLLLLVSTSHMSYFRMYFRFTLQSPMSSVKISSQKCPDLGHSGFRPSPGPWWQPFGSQRSSTTAVEALRSFWCNQSDLPLDTPEEEPPDA